MTLHEFPQPQFRERSIPVLETERLTLRAPMTEDAKVIAALANDRRVAENTARLPYPYRRDDAERFIIEARRSGAFVTVIQTRADGVIGVCGLHENDDGATEIGYWLGVAFWGRGYATEAARGLIDHAFDEQGLDALHSSARVTNAASRRVLEKCGFQWTGVGLNRIRAMSSSAPMDHFRLDRGLWLSIKSWGRAQAMPRA